VLLTNSAAKSLLGAGEKAPGELGAAIAGFEARPPLEAMLDGTRRITPFELHRAEPKLLILSGVADRLGADEDPSGYLMIFHNATLEKRGEVLARNFLSLVSHKLRTPLAVALGHLELLLGDAKNLTDMQRTSLRKIQNEDQKLSGLVEKVIAFSLVQSPENIVLERAPLKVADLIESALSSLDGIHDPSMDVRWSKAGAEILPELAGDRFLLKSAVANLVENAVKFNRGSKKEAVVAARAENGCVRISVTDNGPGIPSEEHPKLFRKFYQIDDDFTGQIPGFGLGLAFVKSVVEAHGGSVGLLSEPGNGSEFFFTIPAKGK
jgi:signal transduction histidine kinase